MAEATVKSISHKPFVNNLDVCIICAYIRFRS